MNTGQKGGGRLVVGLCGLFLVVGYVAFDVLDLDGSSLLAPAALTAGEERGAREDPTSGHAHAPTAVPLLPPGASPLLLARLGTPYLPRRPHHPGLRRRPSRSPVSSPTPNSDPA